MLNLIVTTHRPLFCGPRLNRFNNTVLLFESGYLNQILSLSIRMSSKTPEDGRAIYDCYGTGLHKAVVKVAGFA